MLRSLQRLLPDFNISYSVHLRPYVCLIAISAFSLAIGVGIALQNYIVFEFHDTSGVVGRISVDEYPKQQEFFYYLLALVGIPATIGFWLYWFGWLTYSQWAAQATNQPIHRVLKINAFASVPLWLSWLQIYNFDHAGFLGLTLPIGLTLSLKLILLLNWHYSTRFQPIGGKRDSVSSEPLALQNDTTRSMPRGLRLLRRGCEYILLPIFIYLLIYNGNINHGIDMFHEGERLAPLNQMLHNGVVFRDVYVQHGLFQNAYLAWFGSKIFEPTLMGVRSMERVLGPLGYIALYLLGLQVFRGRFLTAFLCFLIASGANFHVTPRHAFGLLSFACVANYLTYNHEKGLFLPWQRNWSEKPTWILHLFRFGWKLILAGFFTSLAFWYSTEVGLYTLGGIGLFLVIYSLQRRIPRTPTPFTFSRVLLWTPVGFSASGTLFSGTRCVRRCYLEFLHSVQIPTCHMGTQIPIFIGNTFYFT